MPYINVTIGHSPKENVIEDFRQKTVEIVNEVLGKSPSSIMTNINISNSLSLGFEKLEKAIVIEISAFGKTTIEDKDALNNQLVTMIGDTLGIMKDNIYIIFTDKSEWGYKGRLLH